ncbi:hypothetical protein Acr_15g0004690 [Actinidia rufa]|uniref:Uncharacterized protein n=1 Tax=Actinidia rufa TaxID=165716 RepID=A0A7J0FUL4_9ERIC|nr:hypothetical protein Acr_15g0004690 [Actinidia rufa]
MAIEQGRPVLRAKDDEKLDPMVILGQGISNKYLQGCVLGSHDLYILLRERNNSCRLSLRPVLASFTLSVVLSNNARQPAFELLDPKSGSSQQLCTPQFYYFGTSRLANLRNAITGFVVIKRCILICLTTSLNLRHSPEERSFIVYDIQLNEWNFVQTIPGVGVVGDTIYGCSLAGVPLAYKYKYKSKSRIGSSGIDVSLGKSKYSRFKTILYLSK